MAAELKRDSGGAQALGNVAELRLGLFVSGLHRSAIAGAKESGGDTGASQSDDQHALSREIHSRAQPSSPQLQSRERKERENERCDPEAHDDFRFAPAEKLEMMMQRGHAEDALARELERAHLQNHR